MPATLGIIQSQRGGYRLWIEEFASDGERVNVSSVELDGKSLEILRRFLEEQSK